MYLTRPLHMILGSGSPISTSSTYRESASSCFHALTMRPTLMSSSPAASLMLLSASALAFPVIASLVTASSMEEEESERKEGDRNVFGVDERVKKGKLERKRVALERRGRWGMVFRKEQSEITEPTLKAFAILVM